MKLKEQFLPYELAVKLREKGFNETCIALITEKDFLIPLIFDDEEELEFNQEIKKHNNVPCIPTPLYKQAIDWLREKKGWNISINEIGMYSNIEPYTKGIYTAYEYWIYNTHENKKHYLCKYDSKKHIIGDFINNIAAQSYYEALNKAIEEALKLI